MPTHTLKLTESISLDGPHGAYATVRLDEVQGNRATLTVFGHNTTAKAGAPAGALSAATCDALINAVIEARRVLDLHKDKVPDGMRALALLSRAEKQAAGEVYQGTARTR